MNPDDGHKLIEGVLRGACPSKWLLATLGHVPPVSEAMQQLHNFHKEIRGVAEVVYQHFAETDKKVTDWLDSNYSDAQGAALEYFRLQFHVSCMDWVASFLGTSAQVERVHVTGVAVRGCADPDNVCQGLNQKLEANGVGFKLEVRLQQAPLQMASRMYPDMCWTSDAATKWTEFLHLRKACREHIALGRAKHNSRDFCELAASVLSLRINIPTAADSNKQLIEQWLPRAGVWRLHDKGDLREPIFEVIQGLALPNQDRRAMQLLMCRYTQTVFAMAFSFPAGPHVPFEER